MLLESRDDILIPVSRFSASHKMFSARTQHVTSQATTFTAISKILSHIATRPLSRFIWHIIKPNVFCFIEKLKRTGGRGWGGEEFSCGGSELDEEDLTWDCMKTSKLSLSRSTDDWRWSTFWRNSGSPDFTSPFSSIATLQTTYHAWKYDVTAWCKINK